MDRSFLLAVAAALLAAPLAIAHEPAGTPKAHCEDRTEWGTHDYGPLGTGLVILLQWDGNLGGDCDRDGLPLDFDGHGEYSLGGGYLDFDTGDGATGGTLACYGNLAHHFAPITVEDALFGSSVAFTVLADTVNVAPPGPSAPDCGDGEADESILCVGSCFPPFPPGLDGTYTVYVGDLASGSVGTYGHIHA